MQNFSIYIHKPPNLDAVKIIVLKLQDNKPVAYLTIDKKTGYIKENKVTSEIHVAKEFLTIPGTLERWGFIESLLDGILQAGYKPRKESIPEEAEATKLHLQDMRTIAFNFIKMIDEVKLKKGGEKK